MSDCRAMIALYRRADGSSRSREYRIAIGRALPPLTSGTTISFAAIWTALHPGFADVKHSSAFSAEANRAFSSLVFASLLHKSLGIAVIYGAVDDMTFQLFPSIKKNC